MGELKKAIVTGGAGFIGTHLCIALLRKDISVVVYDDFSIGGTLNLPPGIELIKGDVNDTTQLAEAAAGCDVMFHLAAKVTIRGSTESFMEDAHTNVLGALSALKAAHEAKCKSIIFASSMAVYADSPRPKPIPETYPTLPLSPYGVSKLTAEKYLLMLGPSLGLRTLSLRIFNTFGPGQAFTPYVGVITIFVNRLLSGQPPIIFGDGEQTRDLIYVQDVANSFVLAAKSDLNGMAINVGSQKPTTVNQIANMLISRIAPNMKPLYEPARPEELRFSIADITLAKRTLGFFPKSSLEMELDELIDNIRKNKRKIYTR